MKTKLPLLSEMWTHAKNHLTLTQLFRTNYNNDSKDEELREERLYLLTRKEKRSPGQFLKQWGFGSPGASPIYTAPISSQWFSFNIVLKSAIFFPLQLPSTFISKKAFLKHINCWEQKVYLLSLFSGIQNFQSKQKNSVISNLRISEKDRTAGFSFPVIYLIGKILDNFHTRDKPHLIVLFAAASIFFYADLFFWIHEKKNGWENIFAYFMLWKERVQKTTISL